MTESREIKIERDPDIERLASEARRLSMGGGALTDSRRGSLANEEQALNRRASENRLGISRNGSRTQAVSPRLGVPRRQSENQMENGRRSSESQNENGRASPLNHVCHNSKPPSFSRRQSEQLMERRGSYSDATHSSLAKRENSLTRRGSGAGFERRGSTSGGYDSLPRNRSRNSSLNRRGSGRCRVGTKEVERGRAEATLRHRHRTEQQHRQSDGRSRGVGGRQQEGPDRLHWDRPLCERRDGW